VTERRDGQGASSVTALRDLFMDLGAVRVAVSGGLAVELDEAALSLLNDAERLARRDRIGAIARSAGISSPVSFRSYRMGSAFLADD